MTYFLEFDEIKCNPYVMSRKIKNKRIGEAELHFPLFEQPLLT